MKKEIGLFLVLSTCLLVTGVAINMMSDLLKEFKFNDRIWLLNFTATLAMFFGFSYMAYRFGRKLLPVRHLGPARKPEPHKVLIIPVSVLKGDMPSLTGNFIEDIKSMEKLRWNGEMLVRAFQAHQDGLERICFIGSTNKDENGNCSFDQQAQFNRIASLYFQKINPVWDACDFETVSELYEKMNDLIEQALKDGIKEKDIIIDCTGGQKTTSIAAALATLHHAGIEFQYVQTAGNREVKAYNMETVLPS